MDNSQMPPIQQVQPVPPQIAMSGASAGRSVDVISGVKKNTADLVKTIVIIAVSLIAVTFIGLFIWMFTRYNEVSKDVGDKIDAAVTKAKNEQAIEMEKVFSNREKDPYKVFSGPSDYGQLTFEYPKTWSVYVASAANRGGDFEAYFNPDQVEAVGKDTVNALRLTIRNKSFDDVVAEYQNAVNRSDSTLTVESVTFGKDRATGNRYTGNIPGTDLKGYILIFKIRDKTAILRTDSFFFKEDFDRLISTITFNV